MAGCKETKQCVKKLWDLVKVKEPERNLAQAPGRESDKKTPISGLFGGGADGGDGLGKAERGGRVKWHERESKNTLSTREGSSGGGLVGQGTVGEGKMRG